MMGMAEAASLKKNRPLEYVIIGGLMILALILGIGRFKKSGTEDEVFSRKEFNQKWGEIEILETRLPKEESAIIYDAEELQIPFKGPFDEMEREEMGENIVLPEMSFQGMVWKSHRPQAIIDNKVYDINDIIKIGSGEMEQEIKVKDITKDGIHLQYRGKEFIVRPK